jgi:hypothetical protein
MPFVRKQTLSYLFYLFQLFAVISASAYAEMGVNIEFDVNVADVGTARASEVLRTNVVAYGHEYIPETVWKKFFDEQRVGDVLLDTGDISRDSTSLQDLKRRMHELAPLVKRIIAAGGRVQLVFQHGIPKWLSSDPHNNGDLFQGVSGGEKIWHSVPPANYKIWEDVAYEFVRYFNIELNTRGRVYYVIGSEPENYWVGNEDQWHRYYEHFARGALRADPKVKVGGANTVRIDSKTFTKYKPQKQGNEVVFEGLSAKGGKSIVYNWLEFSARKKLPVDIVAWHDYPAPSPIPGKSANWVAYEKQLTAWMSDLGYSGAEFILNDWPEWRPVLYENDSEFQAAYVVSSLISMIKHTNVKALYLGMQDIGAYTDKQEKRKNASFGGGTGLFTSVGLAKPVYNAYSLMSMMEGRLIPVQTGDEFVRALASVDEDKVYILLTNFIPSKRIIMRNTYSPNAEMPEEIDKAALGRKIKATGKSREQLIASILDGSADIQSFDLPPALERKVEGIKAVYVAGEQRMRAPARATIRLGSVKLDKSKGDWRFEEYVIDRSHANSYAARGKISEEAQARGVMEDKSKLRKLVEEVNARTGIDAGRRARSDLSVRGETIELNTSLEPNSVHLIVLQRGE